MRTSKYWTKGILTFCFLLHHAGISVADETRKTVPPADEINSLIKEHLDVDALLRKIDLGLVVTSNISDDQCQRAFLGNWAGVDPDIKDGLKLTIHRTTEHQRQLGSTKWQIIKSCISKIAKEAAGNCGCGTNDPTQGGKPQPKPSPIPESKYKYLGQ